MQESASMPGIPVDEEGIVPSRRASKVSCLGWARPASWLGCVVVVVVGESPSAGIGEVMTALRGRRDLSQSRAKKQLFEREKKRKTQNIRWNPQISKV